MLSITDTRTGKQYEIKVEEGVIRAADLRAIKTDQADQGLLAFDPGLTSTAVCHSTITFIDGEAGILRYRGYPIEQIAEKSTYEAVAYLLLFGELPDVAQLATWKASLGAEMTVPEQLPRFMDAFPQTANPMSMLMSAAAALSAIYPDARTVATQEERLVHARRLIAQMPILAAYAFRRTRGQSYVNPDPSATFGANMLRMFFKPDNSPNFGASMLRRLGGKNDEEYVPNPVLAHALDILFMLHEDHEQNCSTSTVRGVASSGADPYAAIAAGVGALSGPLHGGANEAVLRMLREIGTIDHIPAFIERVKAGDGRLMGFGHRVYKTYDPRAKIVKHTADAVFKVTGMNPLLDIAVELERIALTDEYFLKRRLYPNVDFYSGLIYEAMGLPVEMFPVMFAIGRTPGWVAHWLEFEQDKEKKLMRPLQLYTGYDRRDYPESR